jgi:hypothetical protein
MPKWYRILESPDSAEDSLGPEIDRITSQLSLAQNEPFKPRSTVSRLSNHVNRAAINRCIKLGLNFV